MPGCRAGRICSLVDIYQSDHERRAYKIMVQDLALEIMIHRLRGDKRFLLQLLIDVKPEFYRWSIAVHIIVKAKNAIQDLRSFRRADATRQFLWEQHTFLVTQMFVDMGIFISNSILLCQGLYHHDAWEPQIQFIRAKYFTARNQVTRTRHALRQTQAAIVHIKGILARDLSLV